MTRHEPYTPTAVVMAFHNYRPKGHTIPHTWYQHITFKNGKPDLVAIHILADVFYWYKPKVMVSKVTGQITRIKAKFAEDKLRRSFQYYVDFYKISDDQARAAVARLVEKGLILQTFRHVHGEDGRIIAKPMYLEPVPEAIKGLDVILQPSEPINPDDEEALLDDDELDDEDMDLPSPIQIGGGSPSPIPFPTISGLNRSPSPIQTGDINKEYAQRIPTETSTHPTLQREGWETGAPAGAGAAGAAGGAGAPGWGPVGGIGDDDQAPDGAGGWGGADAPWEPAPGGAGDSPLPSSARVSPTADEEDDDRPYYAESERLLREVIKASAWREFTDVPPAVILEIWQDKQSANAPRGAFVNAMRAYKEQAAQGTAEPVANAGIRAILAERAAEAAVPPPAPAAPPATEDLQLELDWTRIGQVRNALYRELAQIGQHPEDFAVIAWPTASHPYGCYVISREDLIGAYRTIEPAIRRQIAIVAGCAGMAYELIVQIGDPRTLPPPPSSPNPRGPQRPAQRATEDASEPAPPALAAWQEKPRWAPHSQAWLEFANETAEPGRPDWNRQRLCSYMRGAEYRDGWLWSHRVQDQLNGKYRMLVWRVLQEQGLEATPPGERKEPIPGPGDDEPRDMSRFGWGARKAG